MRVESSAWRFRPPTTACWPSGTAKRLTFRMSRFGTSMPEGHQRGCREQPICRVSTDTRSMRAVGALAFSPDGKYLVAGFGSKRLFASGALPAPLKVWKVATRRLLGRLTGHINFCVALGFSPDGKLLASGSRDGTAILWSTATWKQAKTLENPDRDAAHPPIGMAGLGRGSGLFAGRQDSGPGQLWGDRAVVGRRHGQTSGDSQGAFQCSQRRCVFAGWSHPGLGQLLTARSASGTWRRGAT